MSVKFTKISGTPPKKSQNQVDLEKRLFEVIDSPLGRYVANLSKTHPLPVGGLYQEILNPGSYRTMFAQDLKFFEAGTPYIAKLGKINGWVCTVYDFYGKTYHKIDAY